MSPGPTFDRVYHALKEQLLSGRWAPGTHLEPAAIGEDLSASVTPVRDALHRLVGERLVDAPRQDGFWVPSITETELRDLYGWNGDLLAWALRRHRGAVPGANLDPLTPGDPRELFREMAREADYGELTRAIGVSGDRLAEYSAAESEIFGDVAEELAGIAESLRQGDTTTLRGQVAAYHKRRQRAAPQILGARRRALDAMRGR
jgi:DNA-binding GntR family transcriptional regulator